MTIPETSPAPGKPSLTFSIIAYNEARTIQQVIQECVAVGNDLGLNYEILVVNDGSSDDTGELARGVTPANPNVRVVNHSVNLGFGPTLRDAFCLPSKDFIFFLPGDGQIPASELRHLWPHRHETDLAYGWRTNREDPFFRRISSFLYNLLISALLGRRIHDVDSVVVARRSVVEAISPESDTAFFHAELLLRAARRGFRWMERPIAHRPRLHGKSHAFHLRVAWGVLRDLLRYGFRR